MVLQDRDDGFRLAIKVRWARRGTNRRCGYYVRTTLAKRGELPRLRAAARRVISAHDERVIFYATFGPHLAAHGRRDRRRTGVEAFLPISGLMGLLDWGYQGSLNVIHPAATVLVLVAIAIALLVRKAFCSWICPVGFLSELLARLGRVAFGRNYRPWKWLDIPLRSLKYVLMGFFVLSIIGMGRAALTEFLTSPYNKVADVKMGLFFTQMNAVGLGVMATLVIGSVFIHGLWCRYLCPYGALLGLFSWASPTRVRRKADACVSCGMCDKACMARLPVSSRASISSVDCTGCLNCVAVCPVKDALAVHVGRRTVTPLAYAAAVVGLFLAGYVGARATGTWDNAITDREYMERIQNIESGEYGHPGRAND